MVRLFVLLFLFIINGSSQAQQADLVDKENPYVVAHTYYLEDKYGELTFDKASNSSRAYTRSELIVPDFPGNKARLPGISFRQIITVANACGSWS